jgi:hypothetical protein
MKVSRDAFGPDLCPLFTESDGAQIRPLQNLYAAHTQKAAPITEAALGYASRSGSDVLTSSFNRAHGTNDQPIGRHPCRIPRLHGGATRGTLKAAHFPRGGHSLRAAVNGSALTRSVLLDHGNFLLRT